MFDLQWSWLCLPYVVCAVSLATIGVVAAVVRGDRVLRIGVIGAAMTALPWALCSALVACTDDAGAALRLLRLGAGPVALIGPNLLLVLLGLSGQLERHRWAARLAGVVGAVLLGLCWGTDWTVRGVQRLSSGVYYMTGGPLTEFHISQMAMWLAVGLVIARRSMMRGERRKMMRVVIVAAVLAAIGGTDILLLHGVIGVYPIAWLPATISCGITLHLELRTDLLRPRGVDRGVVLELAGFAVAVGLVGAVAFALATAAPVAVAALGSAMWISVIAIMWGIGRRRRSARVFGDRALERFVAGLADLDDERRIAAGLAALWRRHQIGVRAIWCAAPEAPGALPAPRPAPLVDLATGAAWPLEPEVRAWLAAHGEPLAAADLTTMRLGAIRPRLEAAVVAHDATLIVPLVDRDTLVGVVEADHVQALREAERGLVAESARAAARALTYVHLAQIAAREGATAREVEVAEAMRRTAAASRDDELGPWLVAVDYRSAPRTTGAAWSASLLDDGRLALLVTEGQAHGVVAALATAALTGAFAAATAATRLPTLDELVATLAASAEAVRRGGQPIAAFVALVDLAAERIAWGCAGHPGALVVEPGGDAAEPAAAAPAAAAPADAAAPAAPAAGSDSASAERAAPRLTMLGGGGGRLGEPGDAERGERAFGRDAVLVVASRGVRAGPAGPASAGRAADAWLVGVRAEAGSGPRLAGVLVELAAQRGAATDDLLAVVVRRRRGERRSATLAR